MKTSPLLTRGRRARKSSPRGRWAFASGLKGRISGDWFSNRLPFPVSKVLKAKDLVAVADGRRRAEKCLYANTPPPLATGDNWLECHVKDKTFL